MINKRKTLLVTNGGRKTTFRTDAMTTDLINHVINIVELAGDRKMSEAILLRAGVRLLAQQFDEAFEDNDQGAIAGLIGLLHGSRVTDMMGYGIDQLSDEELALGTTLTLGDIRAIQQLEAKQQLHDRLFWRSRG